MTPAKLAAIGTALYGPGPWQRRLALALDVDDSLLRKWMRGARPMPGWLPDALDKLVAERMRVLERL